MSNMKSLHTTCHAATVLLLAFLTTAFLTACSDDDNPILKVLDTPDVVNTDVTVSSLVFQWDEVENVSQYVYELSNPDGQVIAGDVTVKHRVRFTGLQPNTTYTLNVWAYAAVGSTTHKASLVATISATTAAIVPLDAPANVTAETSNSTATITWDAVEYAAGYVYSYIQEGETFTDTTTEPSLTIKNMPEGDYHFSVYAIPGKDDEAHSVSMTSTVNFTITIVKEELWTANGTFSNSTGSWNATITAYSDGSYAINAWYGVEGYDLLFTVDSQGGMEILNSYNVYYGYYFVYTGSTPDHREIYPSDGYSGFTADATGGELWFYDYDDDDYSVFTWIRSGGTVSIDDLVGEWNEHSAGPYEYPWYGDAFDWDGNTVIITKIDDNTIEIANFFYSDDVLTATVDLNSLTITIPAGQEFMTYYTFAAESGIDSPVKATINEDATIISMSGWSCWYNGYPYVNDAVTTLTRK